MSLTTTIGLTTDLEHVELARQKYSDLAETIRNDISATISPLSRMALTSFLECAESGVRLAEQSAKAIQDSNISTQGFH